MTIVSGVCFGTGVDLRHWGLSCWDRKYVCYALGTTRPFAVKRAFQEYGDKVAKIEKLQAHLEKERRSWAETNASAKETAATEEKGRLEESRLKVGAAVQHY